MPRQHSVYGLLLGPVLFVIILLLPLPAGMTQEGLRVAAVTVLMAVWWITEAIPIPATALLPILLFPVLGVLSGADVTRAYSHHLIYLFLGGFSDRGNHGEMESASPDCLVYHLHGRCYAEPDCTWVHAGNGVSVDVD